MAKLSQRLRAHVPALAGWAVAALCVGFAIYPLFAVRYLPLLDQPNHLGAIAIWHHYGDPRFGFADAYALNIHPVPYLGYYGLVHLLAYLLPLETANKLFLAAVIVGFPLSLRALLRAHGRPEILALAAIPLAWCYEMSLGFTAFLASVVLLLFGFALLARFADARPRPGVGLWLANLGLGIAIYFQHPLGFCLWLVGVLVYARWRAPLLATPSLALFVFQLISSPHQGLHASAAAAGVAGRWNGLATNLRLLPVHIFDFIRPVHRWLLLAALAACLALAVALTLRAREGRDRRPLLLVAAMLVLYFILPEHLYRPVNWWMVNGRLILVAVLLAFACVPRGRLSPARAALVVLPVLVISILYPVAIARRFAVFDRKAADFRALVAKLPYNPSVLTLAYGDLWEPAVWVDAWREFPSYVQVERGGYNPWSWGDGFPMRTRPEAVRPAPPGGHPDRFDYATQAAAYEYLLVRDEPAGLLAGRPELSLVGEQGAWRLYRTRPSSTSGTPSRTPA